MFGMIVFMYPIEGKYIIPEMKHIGFIAESVRIPTSTGSLIILVVNFQEEISVSGLNRA